LYFHSHIACFLERVHADVPVIWEKAWFDATIMSSDMQRIKVALAALNEGRIEVDAFCRNFEELWNFHVDQSSLPDDLCACLGALFDDVVWFSPYPSEVWDYPEYRDEVQIRRAAAPVIAMLGLNAKPEVS
jgi:hypothetical protein